MSDSDEELTTSEVSAILGIESSVVRYHAEQGTLVGRMVNPRLWLFRRSAVEAFKAIPRKRGPKGPRKSKQAPESE